jgi:hypothetical protein
LCTPKNRPPQVDAKELPRRSHETLIFKALFAHFVLRRRLGGRSRRALHFENMQYRSGFVDAFDALIGSKLDHRTVTPESKNERRAAWERFGEKRNERRADGNAFRLFMVQLDASKKAPPKCARPLFLNCFSRFLTQVTPRSRRGGAERFERHAPWERDCWQKC